MKAWLASSIIIRSPFLTGATFVLSLLVSSLAEAPASAADPTSSAPFDRHAVLTRAGARPATVPVSYVLTRHGFFHPSCVIRLRADETIDRDNVIRDGTGVERERVALCVYSRFDRAGRLIAPSPFADSAPPRPPPRPHAYDGWLLWYDFIGSIEPGASITLRDDWVVPLPPRRNNAQDVALFNSINIVQGNGNGPADLMQPVLEYGGGEKRWWMISEYCCTPMDMQTEPVDVKVGDVIRGLIEGNNCNAGVCQNWTITTQDLTNGKSAVLRVAGLPEIVAVTPGVLETYNIGSCDMLPASGITTFFNHRLTDGMGRDMVFPYRPHMFSNGDAGELPPNCGWGTRSAGPDQYTLLYGLTPSEPDAGTIPDSGAVNDAADTPVTANDSGSSVGADAAASGAAGGAIGTGAGGAAASGSASDGGTGGNGPPGNGGADARGAGIGGNAGAGCRVVVAVGAGQDGSTSEPRASALALATLVVLLRRCRRRPPRSPT